MTFLNLVAVLSYAQLFNYLSLFEKSPELIGLFSKNYKTAALPVKKQLVLSQEHIRIAAQHARIMINMLQFSVEMLGPNSMDEEWYEVGERHVGYGVQPNHLEHIAEAVVFALAKVLPQEKLTRSIREDWQSVLSVAVKNMKIGMKC